ncbi:MAG: MgtC/SapB family protein [Bacillota bacterium]|nr:MgtC/SapB family protein [Bacillota bacterium]
MTDINEILIKLSLSIILGGLVGLEREYHRRPAGLRTHMLVAVGSAIVMHINISMISVYPSIDPGRFGAQVISGIGFLGAGTIIKEGPTVYGLTTAATLWTVAAIGLAIGNESYLLGIVATILIILVLNIFSYIERNVKLNKKVSSIYLETKDNPDIIKSITELFEKSGLTITDLSTEYTTNKGHNIKIKVNCGKNECNEAIDKLTSSDDITKIVLR